MNNTPSSSLREQLERKRDLLLRLRRLKNYQQEHRQSTSSNIPYRNLNEFFQAHANPIQTFKIPNNQSYKIIGAQGTRLSFRPYTFVNFNNQPIEGQVHIQLREFYKKADLVLSNIPSTSEDRLLETAGTLYLNARYGYLPIRAAQAVVADIQVKPTISNPVAMQVFKGQTTASTNMVNNWLPSVTSSLKLRGKAPRKHFRLHLRELKWLTSAYCYRSRTERNILITKLLNTPSDLIDVQAFLIFHQINTVSKMYYRRGQLMMYNVPKGQAVTVLAIGMSPHSFYLGTKNIAATSSSINSLHWKAISEENLLITINDL